MKRLALFGIFLMQLFFAQAQERLAPADFQRKLEQTPNAILLDVRTQKEINKYYIDSSAVFLDFYDSLFASRLRTLDTTRPVFVYCAIGVRSHDAALMLRKAGFDEVYDLRGGIMNWKMDGLTYIKPVGAVEERGMNQEQFKQSLAGKKLVLVDFYAPWCAPCKIMVPALDSLAAQMGDSVIVVKINGDENLGLMKEMNIRELPMVMIYNGSTEMYRRVGYMSREDMMKLVREYYK
ncbi:MAG: thioredoxin domain-containing protein [Bacteroidia bacterium]